MTATPDFVVDRKQPLNSTRHDTKAASFISQRFLDDDGQHHRHQRLGREFAEWTVAALSSIDNALHSMEAIVFEDSPLAGYLEGLGSLSPQKPGH